MTPSRQVVPELRSIPLTYLDCTAHERKHTMGMDFDGCLWDKLDLYECRLIREHKECPKGFQ